jgi:DNA (cytosine-5)-methyltransferase 1
MIRLRYASLCSGIEAASVAAGPLGWECVFVAEIEPFCCELLAQRYPDAPNLGDMTACDFLDRARACGPIDVLIAGTPCQAFSVAGLRRSLDDDRGNLTLRFLEIANAIDPTWIVWENVPGVLNTEDNAFGCVLAGLVGHPEPLPPAGGAPVGRWCNAGLVTGPRRAACWRVFDAQYFGLAQRRRRVLLVGRRAGNGSGCATILLEPESLPRHSPPRRQTGTHVARSLTASLGGPSGKEQQHTFVAGGGQPLNALDGRLARAVNGDGSRFGSGRDGQDTFIAGTLGVRRLTPRECERLQGFPDDWTRIAYRGHAARGCPDSPRYRALGNSMPVPVMRWIFQRIQTVDRLMSGQPRPAASHLSPFTSHLSPACRQAGLAPDPEAPCCR